MPDVRRPTQMVRCAFLLLAIAPFSVACRLATDEPLPLTPKNVTRDDLAVYEAVLTDPARLGALPGLEPLPPPPPPGASALPQQHIRLTDAQILTATLPPNFYIRLVPDTEDPHLSDALDGLTWWSLDSKRVPVEISSALSKAFCTRNRHENPKRIPYHIFGPLHVFGGLYPEPPALDSPLATVSFSLVGILRDEALVHTCTGLHLPHVGPAGYGCSLVFLRLQNGSWRTQARATTSIS